jgi:hypothetical protein
VDDLIRQVKALYPQMLNAQDAAEDQKDTDEAWWEAAMMVTGQNMDKAQDVLDEIQYGVFCQQ